MGEDASWNRCAHTNRSVAQKEVPEMRARIGMVSVALLGAALIGGSSAAAAAGGGPVITKGGGSETFDDDFILDVCGIVTETTVTERWTHKQFADGSETLQVVRTFDPADPRLPIEKGAATSFTAADGIRRVVGKPLHLIWPHGGTRVVDAGWVVFDADGNVVEMRGPHPSLGADLADLYCP